MQVKMMSKLEFDRLEATQKLLANEHAHQFGAIDLGDGSGYYRLSWGSNKTTPCIERSAASNVVSAAL